VQDLLLSAKHLFVDAMLHFSGVSSSQSQMLALTDAALARLCIDAIRLSRCCVRCGISIRPMSAAGGEMQKLSAGKFHF